MMESGLGAALMGRGLADELKQATFSIGPKGVAKEDVPKVEGFPPPSLRPHSALTPPSLRLDSTC